MDGRAVDGHEACPLREHFRFAGSAYTDGEGAGGVADEAIDGLFEDCPPGTVPPMVVFELGHLLTKVFLHRKPESIAQARIRDDRGGAGKKAAERLSLSRRSALHQERKLPARELEVDLVLFPATLDERQRVRAVGAQRSARFVERIVARGLVVDLGDHVSARRCCMNAGNSLIPLILRFLPQNVTC